MSSGPSLPSAEVGATLVFVNAPAQLVVNIDYNAWKINPNFLGVAAIPEGPHFVSWQPPDEEDINILGMFIYLEPKQVAVFRWYNDTDSFRPADDDEIERYKLAVQRGELSMHLGPYPIEWILRWKEVSRYISKKTIDRIEPIQKFVMSATKEYDKVDEQKAVGFVNALIEAGGTSSLNGLEANDEKLHVAPNTLFFCDIPKSDIPARSTPSEVTHYSIDRSNVLLKLVNSHFDSAWNELLGELQFAYICFLLGQNYEAFEHWRELIILLCSCEEAVLALPMLYKDFLRVLHNHLTQFPDDFFYDALSHGNFLAHCISNLMEICKDERTTRPIQKRAKLIEELVQIKFHMTIQDLISGTEDSPTVVDPDAKLVSWENDKDPMLDDEDNNNNEQGESNDKGHNSKS